MVANRRTRQKSCLVFFIQLILSGIPLKSRSFFHKIKIMKTLNEELKKLKNRFETGGKNDEPTFKL